MDFTNLKEKFEKFVPKKKSAEDQDLTKTDMGADATQIVDKASTGSDKKRLIIQGVLVVAVVILGVDIIMAPSEVEEEAVVQAPKPKAKIKKQNKVAIKKEAPQKVEVQINNQEESKNEDRAPENPNQQDKSQEIAKIAQTQPQSEEVNLEGVFEESQGNEGQAQMQSPNEQLEQKAPEEPQQEEMPFQEVVVEEIALPAQEPEMENSPDVLPLPQSVDKAESMPMSETLPPTETSETTAIENEKSHEEQMDQVQQILSNINNDPNAPEGEPNYFINGRGLVYDCEKKRWACLNRVNYFRCAKGQKKSMDEGKSPSCVIQEVYFSTDHCARGQLQKIHKALIPESCEP